VHLKSNFWDWIHVFKVDFSSFGRLGFGVTSKPKNSGFSATFKVKKIN